MDKKQNYKDERDRIEVERRFSLAKRKCGLGLISKRLGVTIRHCVAMSIILLNLKKVLTRFGAWLSSCGFYKQFYISTKLSFVVQ